MTTRARLQNTNDSKSLWNFSLSPGWSQFDAHILRLSIIKYGCGAWKDINRHFPRKSCGQLNLQTQRLFGQQALAEFQRLHIDPSRVKQVNDTIEGFRKNTCLINTGNNMTPSEKAAKKLEHETKFGVPAEVYENLNVPVVMDVPTDLDTHIHKIDKLREMYRVIYDIQLRRRHLAEQKNNPKKNGSKKTTKSTSQPIPELIPNKNNNSNNNIEKKQGEENVDNNKDVEMINDNNKKKKDEEISVPSAPVDEDVALALALSASMDVNTPAIQKKSQKKSKKNNKKQSAKKKSAKKSAKKKTVKKSAKKKTNRSKKRKNMEVDDDDDEYVPGPAPKKVKRA